MNKILTYVIGLTLFVFMSAASATNVPRDSITLSGSSNIYASADVAYVTLYVQSKGLLIIDAENNATETIAAIRKDLKQSFAEIIKIEETLISAGAGKRSWKREDDVSKPVVIKRIRITAPPKQELLFNIVDKSIRKGALLRIPSDISYPGKIKGVIVYGIKNYSKLELDAKKLAIKNAKKQATEFADMIGKKIGAISGLACSGSIQWTSGYTADQDAYPTKYIGLSKDKILISHKVTVSFKMAE